MTFTMAYGLSNMGLFIFPSRIAVAAFSAMLIFSILFSRIYLGAHWFTDVLGGFLLGLICLYLLCVFYFGETAPNEPKAKS